MNLIPFIIGGGLLAFYYLRRAGENLKVNLTGVSVKKASGLSLPYLLLKFNIQNVTNTFLNINGIVGDIYINDEYFANVSNLNKVVVPANGSLIYEVKVDAGVLDTITNLISLITKKTKKIKITGNLSMNVNGIILPITISRVIV
jgi:LEA14-like dessication related protein